MKYNKAIQLLNDSYLQVPTINMDNIEKLRKGFKKIAPKVRKLGVIPTYADIEALAKKMHLKYTEDEIEYIEDEIEDIIKGK